MARERRSLEADVMPGIRRVLELHGVIFMRSNAGAVPTSHGTYVRLAPRSWPDWTGCLPTSFGRWSGRFLAIEVKRPGKAVREGQLAKLLEFQTCGAVAFWTTDGAETHRILEAAKRGKRVVLSPEGEVSLISE